MTTNPSNDDDSALRALLREWKTDPTLPPRFNDRVWRRIDLAEAAPAPDTSIAALLSHWIATLLPRRVPATAYLAFLLVVGASAGWSQARHETARVNSNLSTRYVHLVDPFQTPHSRQ